MTEKKKKKIETADLVRVALGAALMCVVSPLNFPLGTTHITLAIFGVYLVAAVFGKYRAALSMVIYIALGAVGLPVFAGFNGGISRLLSQNGGFIIGYIPCALVTGLVIDILKHKKFAYPLGMVAGTVFCYACGALWFMIYNQIPFTVSLAECILPYLAFDAVKIVAGSFCAYNLRKGAALMS